MLKNLFLTFTTFLLISCSAQNLILVDGKSDYKIIIAANATIQEEEAAMTLQDYLKRISSVELPIITDASTKNKKEIVVGNTNRSVAEKFDRKSLGEDGFQITTKGDDLYIFGGTKKGTIYGVYSFLEEYLGCRMYAADAQYIPKKTFISLPDDIMDRQVPRITRRYLGNGGVENKEYALWNKLNGSFSGPSSKWGLFVHTFKDLVPANKFYKSHPEYYAYFNGKRTPSQLCLSNPEVLKLVVENLKERIAKNPDAIYWAVSQNDNTGYCRCDKCSKIDKEEGSPSGSVIRFVNKVAAYFPNKIIPTLAYMYTRKAPKIARPTDNVMVMLCSIEVNRSRPIATDSLSTSFRKDIEAWEKIAKNIFMWDYVIQFKNLVSPFPNLRVLQPNLLYFANHNVTSMFEQGNYGKKGLEFSELRSYLLAKLMWNPNANTDSLITDFTNGYYGKGGKYVKEYIDLIHDNLEKSGDNLAIFGSTLGARNSYLSSEDLRKYNELFDQAELAVKDDSEFLTRVKTARLPLTFIEIEYSRTNPLASRSLFVKSKDKYRANPIFIKKVNDFITFCNNIGIKRLTEIYFTPNEYLELIESYTDFDFNGDFAIGKKISTTPDLFKTNSKSNPGVLTDGLFGTNEYSPLWLKTSEKNYNIIVNLGEARNITNIAAHFMNNNASTVFLPALVEFFLSSDGISFKKVGEQSGPPLINETMIFGSYASGSKTAIPKFYEIKNVKQKKAAFVKVKVTSIGEVPVWHPDVGLPALTLIDEIVIQ